MTASLTFEWDRNLARLGPQLSRGLFNTLRKAGSDAARSMRTESSKRVRGRKNFRASAVRKGLSLEFPKGASDLESLVWTMRVDPSAVPLSSFPHRQARKGVRVRVNKGKAALVKGAFVATMKSGHEGVFVRRGKKQLPIDELFSTRLTDPFKDSDLVPAVFAAASAKFASTFARLYPIEVGKADR